MLQDITSRIPAGLVALAHQAVDRGAAYACLLLLTAALKSVFEPAPCLACDSRPASHDR